MLSASHSLAMKEISARVLVMVVEACEDAESADRTHSASGMNAELAVRWVIGRCTHHNLPARISQERSGAAVLVCNLTSLRRGRARFKHRQNESGGPEHRSSG